MDNFRNKIVISYLNILKQFEENDEFQRILSENRQNITSEIVQYNGNDKELLKLKEQAIAIISYQNSLQSSAKSI